MILVGEVIREKTLLMNRVVGAANPLALTMLRIIGITCEVYKEL